jgi:hypothetical protein
LQIKARKAKKRPILFVDVDGVISLFGFSAGEPPGSFHQIEGIVHCIGHEAGRRLKILGEKYELVWATGWEEKANEYLPRLLGLDSKDLPTITFGGRAVFGSAHWKVDAIDDYAKNRPAAWIDDNLDDTCRAWAEGRSAPTLLVQTHAPVGITEEDVELLLRFADQVAGDR